MSTSDNHLPKNLFFLRKRRGLNQDQMQACVGIQRTTWSNYENGVTEPSINDLISFSKFFGISLDDLVTIDLEAREHHFSAHNNKGKNKVKPYPENEHQHVLEEHNQEYVLSEIRKLWEEMEALKNEATTKNKKAGKDSQE